MFEIHPVKKVSVVIPVYNEQESLPELIRRTTTACESLGKEYEILLIDDGSSDNSAHMLVEASKAETAILCLFCLTAITGNIQRLWRDSVTLLAT
ncbi:undecaprenyl phosphate 4-deoxy-4-formamido-L-arabinose transferase [Shigella sonnei]|nr:undecaprenyl phosphate 4-deoxy-4-formamido-L-arabinose transferase [Shigella sonnei]